MNVNKLKGALNTFAGKLENGVTPEELKDLILQNEKPKYTDEEADEIIEALQTPKAEKVTGFDEYMVQRNTVEGKTEFAKLRKLRSGVQITAEEAETLNSGRKEGPNTIFNLFFPAE